MPTNETADPAVEEAERRVERAKASLLARVEQLKHKLSEVRETFDLSSQISKHALPAVGIAFALGAAAGLRRGGARAVRDPDRSGVSGAVLAALGAFGLRVVRDLAIGQLGVVAKQWWDEQPPELPIASVTQRAGGEPAPPTAEH